MSADETTGTITVRKVPADCIAKLKATAKSHNRSMESEVRSVLEDYAAGVLARHIVSNADLVAEMRLLLDSEGLDDGEDLCPPRDTYDDGVRPVDFGKDGSDDRH